MYKKVRRDFVATAEVIEQIYFILTFLHESYLILVGF